MHWNGTKKLVASIIALAMTATLIPEMARAGSCSEKIINRCKDGGRDAWNGGGDLGSGMYGGTSSLSSANQSQGIKMGQAASACKDMKGQCKSCPKAEQQECEKGLDKAGGEMKAQSASMGDMSSMLGAMAGLAAAAMQMANQQDKDEQQQQQNNSALQPNGQIDCSKQDAYMFPDCDSLLSASCKNAMEDPRCTAFANRYCGGQGVSAAGVIGPGVPYGGAGQGVGSMFCGFVAAYGYCRSGGHDSCPSCLRLQKESSQVCQSNPAMCLAQNSPEVLANSRAQCAGDPVYADPSVAGAAAFVNGNGTQMPTTGGAGSPIAVLPGQGGGGGGTPVVNPVAGGGGGTTNPVVPRPPVVPAPGLGNPPVVNPGGGVPPVGNGGGNGVGIASRDGTPNGTANAIRVSPGGNGVAAGTVITLASVGGGNGGSHRDVAGTGGIRPSSANLGGPAPDVQGQYGPSLFTVGSTAIRSRCAAGLLLNCH